MRFRFTHPLRALSDVNQATHWRINMMIIYATAAVLVALGLTTLIGLIAAKHLDKKYGTENVRN